MPLISPDIEKNDPRVSSNTPALSPLEPKESHETHRFFVATYFATAIVLLITAGLYFLFLHSALMEMILSKMDHSKEFTGLIVFLFLLGPVLYGLFAVFYVQYNHLWLRITLVCLYPVFTVFYFGITSRVTDSEWFGTPMVSTATGFIAIGLIGLGAEKIFYLKIISYLKFLLGVMAMITMHDIMKPTYAVWFLAIPYFYLYDFLGSDSSKLFFIQNHVKGSGMQKVIHATISILLISPFSANARSKDNRYLVHSRWIRGWEKL